MSVRSNVFEAFNSLLGSKQRSLLALIGIVVGIGSVIAMVSVGHIVQQEALRQFLEMGTDIVTITKLPGTTSGKLKKEIELDHALDLPVQCEGIAATAPYASLFGEMKFNAKKIPATALGVTPDFYDLNTLTLASGRFVHALDTRMYYAVLGHETARELKKAGAAGDLVGTRVIFRDLHFTVIGVLEQMHPSPMSPYSINSGLLIPISTLRRMDRKAGLEAVMARTAKGVGAAAAEQAVQDYFIRRGGPRVGVRSAEAIIAQMQKQMRLYTLLLGTIGSISLIVGGIGVMNVMLVSVTERTREIGIRRALGAKQGDIQFQFLVESVVLCIFGGIIGIGLGVGVSWIVAYYSRWQFSISNDSIAMGVAVAVTVGVFFGFYPARQAARLSPIQALRGD